MLSSDYNRPGFILCFETFARHPLSCNIEMIVQNHFRFGGFACLILELSCSFQQPEGHDYNIDIAAREFPPPSFG